MILKNKKHVLIASIVAGSILFFTLAFFAVRYYKHLNAPGSSVVAAIPKTAGLIIEINNAPELWHKLSAESTLWNQLSLIEPFKTLNRHIIYADSLKNVNADLADIIQSSPLYISCHPAVGKICHFLFLTDFSGRGNVKALQSIFESLYADRVSFRKKAFKDVDILEVKLSSNTQAFYFATYKGVLFGSSENTLVEDAIIQLNTESSLANDPAFQQVALTVGKKVDANVFINFAQCHRILLSFTADSIQPALTFMPRLGQWSGLDLNLKDDALVFNGFTNPLPNDEGFLNRMLNQPPPKIEVTRLLPYNTAAFIYFGFDNFKLYYNKYLSQCQKDGSLQALKSELASFNNQYKLNTETDIVDYISSEITLASVPSGSPYKDFNTYLIIKFKDRDKLLEINKLFALGTTAPPGMKPDTSAYKDYTISYFDHPDIFNSIAGTDFNISELYYGTIAENYLIMAESRESLVNIINAIIFNRNLNNNLSYNKFSNYLSNKANIFVYNNNALSLKSLRSYLKKPYSDSIVTYFDNITHFESFAIQLSESNGMFYNNICLASNSDKESVAENYSLWETVLEQPAERKLTRVTNHNDNSSEVLVYDVNKNLYLIDKTGAVIWKTTLNEPLLGDVIQIDFYNNSKLQYLFNTASQIYLIDRNGQNVAGFPVKLKQKATNGIAVFDYDNNKNYRIFLATEKNEIINLDKNAEKISGWNMFKTLAPVKLPVQFVRLLGKDFICVTDEEGKPYFLDRKGDIRIKTDKPVEKSTNSLFYTLITADKKGKFVFSGKKGKIYLVDFNGKTEEVSLNTFSEKHFFIYEDIDNNTLKEYIFIDNNKLTVYDQNKNLMKEFSFDGSVETAPVYFPNNKYKLGVATASGKIYLFYNNMEVVSGFPMEGSVPFIVETSDTATAFMIAAKKEIVFKHLLK